MAKKPKKVEAEPEEPMVGFPAHGDLAPDDGDHIDPVEDDEDEDETPPPEDDVATLKKRLDDQQRELENLRRQTPPAQPKPQPEPKNEDDIDWEELLYKDPKKALELHGQRVAQQVTTQIRNEYQKEKGTEKFWNGFYEKHKDLKADHDLVDMTLKANLNTLANIPIDEAMEKLADLTRTRIMRYAGNKAPGKKVRVEGSDPPRPKKEEVPSDKPSSLSDIIKARKSSRRATAA